MNENKLIYVIYAILVILNAIVFGILLQKCFIII